MLGFISRRTNLLALSKRKASDFSHIFEGLKRHEVNDLLTPDLQTLQKEALNFSLKKLAPFAA